METNSLADMPKVELSPMASGEKKSRANYILKPEAGGIGTDNISEPTEGMKLMAKLNAQEKLGNIVAEEAGVAITFGDRTNREIYEKGCVVITAPVETRRAGQESDSGVTSFIAVDNEGIFAIQAKDGQNYNGTNFTDWMKSRFDLIGDQSQNTRIDDGNFRQLTQYVDIKPLPVDTAQNNELTKSILTGALESARKEPFVSTKDKETLQKMSEKSMFDNPEIIQTPKLISDEIL